MDIVERPNRIADAMEACDWSGSPIGNKEILKAAVLELRSLRAERDAAYRKGAEDMRERAAVLAEGPATDWGYYVGGTPERDKIAAAIRKLEVKE